MPDKTTEQLLAEIAELNKKIEELSAENAALKAQMGEGIPKEIAALVKEKRAAGLDIPTAIQAAKNQVAWDKQQAEEKKKAEAAKAVEKK